MPRTSKNNSTLHYLLKGLLPYSRENLTLSFNPNKFFNGLERQSGYARKSFVNAVRKAEQNGLIVREGNLLKITEKGKQEVKPFVPAKLNKNAQLMVIFDIPEYNSYARKRFRLLLREWRFVMVQRSVWVSNYDYRNALVAAVKELKLEDCVQAFECAKFFPKK
jgi:DNA-binding transcriptional regulator PaaX